MYEFRKSLNSSNSALPPTISNCEWYYTAYVCNCSAIANSASSNFNTTCACLNGLIWKDYACIANCSDSLSAPNPNNLLLCACSSGSSWNFTISRCQRNCSGYGNSTGRTSAEDPGWCECDSGFFWNQTGSCCSRCGSLSNPNSNVSTAASCKCNSNWVWHNDVIGCIPLCESFLSANGTRPDLSGCNCYSPYVWDTTFSSCVIDCSRFSHIKSVHPVSVYTCDCIENYYWTQTGCVFCRVTHPTCGQ